MFEPGSLIIDVRSPSEYAHGHVPGAVNIPLFSDEERAAVGTAYTQVSREAAMDLGLQIVGPKLFSYVEQLRTQLADGSSTVTRPLTMYCWRGGMRSSSMAWLFRTAGYTVHVVPGGYKAYRRDVLSTLEYPWRFAVIGGRTGSGKTRVLQVLKQAGEQVLDLEGIAHHKGSSFGALNQPPQPSSEHAANEMAAVLSQFDKGRVVFVEDESLRIGTVALHIPMYEHLRTCPVLVLDVPRDVRASYLAVDYGAASPEELRTCFHRIQTRLGGERFKRAMASLDKGDLAAAADVALDYYDRTYEYGLSQRGEEQLTVVSSSHELSTDAILARCRLWVQDLAADIGEHSPWGGAIGQG